MVEGMDFLECWKWLCAKYGKEGEAWDLMRWVVGGLWRIWKCRNSLVFEKVAVEPFVAIQLLKQQWKEMKVCEEAQTGIGGVGWVARDFVGIFKDVGGVGKIPCVSSIMAEAEVMRVALLACVEKGLESIQLETDSQVLVDMIHGWLQPEAVLDGILWDISLLKQQFDVIEFLYAPRAYNEATHLVVSYVTRVGGSHSWDGFEPKWLFNTLASDVNF
ncbi:uncharacterized protein [Pyrus communis]|uniref:uncharacterized protein n=1 Tax=Pyrus communis TaxID=23211 RepID=UPI0035BFE168